MYPSHRYFYINVRSVCSIDTSLYRYMYVSIHLPIYLYIFHSIYLSIFSMYPSIHPPIHTSIYLSTYLSICLLSSLSCVSHSWCLPAQCYGWRWSSSPPRTPTPTQSFRWSRSRPGTRSLRWKQPSAWSVVWLLLFHEKTRHQDTGGKNIKYTTHRPYTIINNENNVHCT